MVKRIISIALFFITFFVTGCAGTAVTDAPKTTYDYSINYYMEQTSGAFSLAKSDNKKITTDKDTYTVNVPSFEGYEFDEDNEQNVVTLPLVKGGTNVYYLYYNYATYTVTAEVDGKVYFTETVRYAGYASKPKSPKKKGYVFETWRAETGEVFDFSSAIKKDVKITPEWRECDEEAENYLYVAADYYFKDGDDEYVYMLGTDKSLSLLVNGVTRGDGTYRYGKDGYVTLNFLYGEMKGVTFTGEKNDRYLCLDDGKTLSRFGHTLHDFSSKSELSAISAFAPADRWGKSRRTASVAFVDEFSAAEMTERAGSLGVHGGAAAIRLEQYPLSENPTAYEFYNGGVTVDLGKTLKTEGLKIVLGLYMTDYLGGDGRIRSSDDEVFLFGTVGADGKGAYAPYGKWLTVGRGGAPETDVLTWMAVTLDESVFGAEEIDNVYIKSFRDDGFYIDFVAYYYE